MGGSSTERGQRDTGIGAWETEKESRGRRQRDRHCRKSVKPGITKPLLLWGTKVTWSEQQRRDWPQPCPQLAASRQGFEKILRGCLVSPGAYVTPRLQQGATSPASGTGGGCMEGFSPQLLRIQQHDSAPEHIRVGFQITFSTNAPLSGHCYSRLHLRLLIPPEPVQQLHSLTRDAGLRYPPRRSPGRDLLSPLGTPRVDQFGQGRGKAKARSVS